MNWVTTIPLLLLGSGVGLSSQFARHWFSSSRWEERKKHGMQMDTENGKKLVVNGTNVVLMGNGWEGFAAELERVLKSNNEVEEITTIGRIGEGGETICKLGKNGQQTRETGLWEENIVWTGAIDQKGVSCFKQEDTTKNLKK